MQHKQQTRFACSALLILEQHSFNNLYAHRNHTSSDPGQNQHTKTNLQYLLTAVPAGRSGSYIGSPQLGLVNYFQADPMHHNSQLYMCMQPISLPFTFCVFAGRSGSYIGSPQLGLVKYFHPCMAACSVNNKADSHVVLC
jgi:hypothetical protein